MSRLTRDGTAETVSRDQILRRERGLGNIPFLCSADHEQDWQPYRVNAYSCYMYVMTIHTLLVPISQYVSSVIIVAYCILVLYYTILLIDTSDFCFHKYILVSMDLFWSVSHLRPLLMLLEK